MAANSHFERLVDSWFDAAKIRRLSAALHTQIESLRDEIKQGLGEPLPKYVEFEGDAGLFTDLEQYTDAVAGVASHLLQAKFDVPEEWTVDDKQLGERLHALLDGKLKAHARKKAVALNERFDALARIAEIERAIIGTTRD